MVINVSRLSVVPETIDKTTNWRRYNQALKSRGALMIWLDRELQWSGVASGKRGRTPTFSDIAIQFFLTIKGLECKGGDFQTICMRCASSRRLL